MSERTGGGWQSEVAFLRRTLIVAAVVVLLLFAWTVRGALLLAFGAVLVAVLFRILTGLLARWCRLPERWALASAILLTLLPIAAVFLLVGNELVAQGRELINRLPEAVQALDRVFGIELPVPGQAAEGSPVDASAAGSVAMQAANIALLALDALAAAAIAIVGGIYLAADPGLYRRGIVRLVPRAQQGRLEDAMDAAGNALGLWLKARLVTMTVVAVLTGLGAWAIGLPAPLALALVAGLADLVPLIGPFIGAVPGVLLALNMGYETIAWTILLYVAVQQIEGYLISPILEQRLVSVPAGLMLFSVVAAGAVFGIGGVLLAGPLAVVTVVMVGKLYVRETLGRNVEVPGEGEEG